jgi:8-oxo-dGTP pyrophosphatase MutT (NUDIX family)
MYCNNCGKRGHLYKECKLPVTSCGNIVFRLDKDEPEILMIQRKDSLCYIDFIRGKYDINNINYLQILINKCSITEKEYLVTKDFKELWINLWLISDDFSETDDYLKSYNKFSSLRKGYRIKGKQITIDILVKNSNTNYEMSEWEFPKGRRNSNENDFDCAKREFKEETSYEEADYDIITNVCPLTEEFVGENRVRYKYIYYIGQLKNIIKIPIIDSDNKEQITEIKNIKWLTKDQSLGIIRDYHYSRKKIIEQIYNFIEIVNDTKYSLIS